MHDANDPILTAEQVAERLQVTRQTVNAWVRRGVLVPIEMVGVRRFYASDVEAAIRANRQSALTVVQVAAQPPRIPVVGAYPPGDGWNTTAGRPFGYTRAAWKASGLTKETWLARQQRPAPRRRADARKTKTA